MPILPRLSSPQDDTEEYPFLFECGKKNCFYVVTARTMDEARSHYSHKCPYGSDIQIGASLTQSILARSWEELDKITATLKAIGTKDPEYAYWRGEARGVAKILALFMVPHFRTIEEISREALVRYTAAKNGEEHETPGLGSLKYTFPSDDKYKSVLAREADTKARKEKGTETIDPKTREDILVCKGTFTAEQTADVYSVSVATVTRVWAEG